MINPANEILGQARQGSVAAIIQVLNERLADVGIRTRAVVAEGMLQLLCEAATVEQLEQTAVVDRVRTELETISPQRIKKVKINSRIVKEEQLLWLEDINRDPENSLLWAEVIILKRPFFIKRWIRDRNLKPGGPLFKDISEPETPPSPLLNKIVGMGGLILLLLGGGWVFRDDISQIQRVANQPLPETASPQSALPPLPTQPNNSDNREIADPSTRTADITPQRPPSLPPQSTPQPSEPAPSASSEPPDQPKANNATAVPDAFAEAVRIADQAAIDGQTASTAAEWLDLAARWQRASDLMSEIPEDSEQYEIAQARIQTYKNNSTVVLQQAQKAP